MKRYIVVLESYFRDIGVISLAVSQTGVAWSSFVGRTRMGRRVFDLKAMMPHPYDEMEKNVFWQASSTACQPALYSTGTCLPICKSA